VPGRRIDDHSLFVVIAHLAYGPPPTRLPDTGHAAYPVATPPAATLAAVARKATSSARYGNGVERLTRQAPHPPLAYQTTSVLQCFQWPEGRRFGGGHHACSMGASEACTAAPAPIGG
jgi:hypothetical protein